MSFNFCPHEYFFLRNLPSKHSHVNNIIIVVQHFVTMEGLNGEKRRNKKKPKSFLQKAKKFGKRCQFGRGRQIDKDTYDYFVRVMETISRGDFNSEEDKEDESIFVANVFSQTVDKECQLCGNQLVSRVLEKLLPKADKETRSRFRSAESMDSMGWLFKISARFWLLLLSSVRATETVCC